MVNFFIKLLLYKLLDQLGITHLILALVKLIDDRVDVVVQLLRLRRHAKGLHVNFRLRDDGERRVRDGEVLERT